MVRERVLIDIRWGIMVFTKVNEGLGVIISYDDSGQVATKKNV